ncbi:MAG: UDP-N-acetylmuramoyl-L-alanine--D-glutamate ligase [Actinophytocola sp.]|nr:UDP-N-acetylmuramoyl-L-alanine--D-glutamate ligase [Actinophytocola sp.]
MLALAGRAVLVAGAGVTGRSVVTALLAAGARVTVTDADAARLAELAGEGVELRPGLTAPPEGTELVVTSPGWRPGSPVLAAALAAGIEVIGDVELAWRIGQRMPRPPVWLAVTGTNGKTTTVGMLESMLRAAGANSVACGNVGFAVLDAVLAGYQVLAVELSSFQLHWSNTLAPLASVVLNVAEDHLDWHGDLTAYAAAKGKLHANAGTAVYNAQDPISRELAFHCGGSETARVGFSLASPRPSELGVVEDLLIDRAYVADPAREAEELAGIADVSPAGPHNVANALAAAALARAYGVPPSAVREGLLAFTPGAHRAVPVADVAGVRYINDSKATNPHAAAGSLTAHEHVVWLAGGQLKGAEVEGLVQAVAGRLRGVVLFGADSDVIEAAVRRHAPDVPVKRVDSGDDDSHADSATASGEGGDQPRGARMRRAERAMTAAVRAASTMAHAGDVVLLAPAAASFDMFRDYAHRGEAFAAAVHALAAGEPDSV